MEISDLQRKYKLTRRHHRRGRRPRHRRRLPIARAKGLRFNGRMSALTRPQKITFGEMRDSGVRGLLIYCSDFKCSHSIAISGEKWPDSVRLSVLESRFTCQACGKKGADVRPDFNWNKQPVAAMGYR